MQQVCRGAADGEICLVVSESALSGVQLDEVVGQPSVLADDHYSEQMVDRYPEPVRIPVPGGKIIDEHIGLASTGEDRVSVAHMVAPAGWQEPFQTPEFDEFTVVLRGQVIVEHGGGERTTLDAGQSIKTTAGERIRYSCGPEGADYLAVCLPAFSPETVNRDE